MKQTIAILGKPGSGVSSMAKHLTKDHKFTVWLHPDDLKSTFPFNMVKKKTKYIVVDNVTKMEQVYKLIYADVLIINRQCKRHFEIERPCVIICSNNLTVEDFPLRKMTFIHIPDQSHGNSN